MTVPDDNELVARVRAGEDSDAFGELVRRHQSQVRIFLLRLCRDGSRADDLAQDCFLHAWQKLDSFRGDGAFGGWLLRIAWTTFLQSKRRGDRYREIMTEVAGQPQGDTHVRPVDDVSDLDRLLAVLDEDERAIMILSYALGMSHAEISKTTELPVGTVKSVIHRAKLKIRQNFEIANHQHG